MNAQLKRQVWRRAGGRCEYCFFSQRFDELPFHIDHIIALKHRGPTSDDNLALACASCSLAKGSNIAGHDPRSGRLTRLFHPRSDRWQEHFRWRGAVLVGKTAVGRTTIAVLAINDHERVELRELLIEDGLFPGEIK